MIQPFLDLAPGLTSRPFNGDVLEIADLVRRQDASSLVEPRQPRRYIQPFLDLAADVTWIEVKDGNDTARALFDQHYSRHHYADGRKPLLFVGPGEKLVLLTPDARAVFCWRKFQSDNGQNGVNCAVFRNDGAGRASDLIRAADEIAWQRWPGERLYTYVNDRKVRRSRTPGRCFLKAGWRYVRGEDGKPLRTKTRKYLILERLPEIKTAAEFPGGQDSESAHLRF